MRTIIKWDKKSPINDSPAEKVLNDNPSYAAAPIYLVVKNDRVEMIEDARIIRNNHDLTGTEEEVMNKYLDMLNGVEQAPSETDSTQTPEGANS